MTLEEIMITIMIAVILAGIAEGVRSFRQSRDDKRLHKMRQVADRRKVESYEKG